MTTTGTTWDRNPGLLADAVRAANIPTLLCVLTQLTGDWSWLSERYQPSPIRGIDDNDSGGLPIEVRNEIRAASVRALEKWFAGRVDVPVLDEAQLCRILSFSTGEDVPSEYGPFLHRELSNVRSDKTTTSTVASPSDFHVAIVGAGLAGICAAVRLQGMGVRCTVFEKRHHSGGTWHENQYLGCGVDTPAHLYSYSFAPHDWRYYYPLRDELLEYIDGVAEKKVTAGTIKFGHEVVEATWDATERAWLLVIQGPAGQQHVRVNALITAVGAFNKPKFPAIAGLSEFDGQAVHTAQWSPDIDVSGRDVAVVGNGASAMQLVPAIAHVARSLAVYQRTPQWVVPFAKFRRPIPLELRWLLRSVPLYYWWYRLRLAWIYNDRLYDALQKDPNWPHPAQSVNEINDGHRSYLTRYIAKELAGRDELIEAVTPHYPPFAKRILVDNGWYRTLTRSNVELVTSRIDRIVEHGVVTADGNMRKADLLVLATGFDVVRFLNPIRIVGRSGTPINQVWHEDDARAYLGTVVPDFPNMFCLYGPNLQASHGGSLISIFEAQLDYISSLLTQMIERNLEILEVRREVFDAYNAKLDAGQASSVVTHPGVDSYFKNASGRVVVNNPFRVVDFWGFTRHANLDEYHLDGR